jgi:hypothetical protein
MVDVFVSYSRKDKEFVQKLVAEFKREELDVWVDFEDIPFAMDWWDEIVSGIDNAQTCIFVLSSDSVQSKVCSLEVSHILKSNKRLIPIVCRDENLYGVDSNTFIVPQEIRKLNWIFFNQSDVFESAYKQLRQTMNTDLEGIRAHTRLQVRAREWQKAGAGSSYVSFGDELVEFQKMLTRADLNEVQRAFLQTSLSQEAFRNRLARFVWGFIGGLLGMGYYVLTSYSVDNLLMDATPIALAVAAGEVFGAFVGLMALLSQGLPEFMSKRLSPRVHQGVRVVLSVLFGTLCWMIFQWLFLQLGLRFTISHFIGGLGLSIGYILPIFVRLRTWVAYGLTVLFIFLPILLLNGTSGWEWVGFEQGQLKPLIYFREVSEVWTIGLPMALLMALGAVRPGITRFVMGRLQARQRAKLLAEVRPV